MVLAQPRRMALLAYLAVAHRHRFHRRDTLVSLFWPESAERPARDLLNTNVSRLRASLGADALQSRGNEEIGVNSACVWCDVWAFEAAYEAGKGEAALALYRGDLLDGFHISGAPEFDRWLDAERRRLRDMASSAAFAMAERRRDDGDVAAARRFVERGAALSLGTEDGFRRAIALLDIMGDRAGALRLYEILAVRLRQDHDAEPAPETQHLIERVRARSEARAAPATPGAQAPAAAPNAPESAPAASAAPATPAAEPLGAAAPAAAGPAWARRLAALSTRSRIGVGVAAAAILLAIAALRYQARLAGQAASDVEHVAVFPFAAGGGDAEYLREGMTDLLTARLDGMEELSGVDPRAVLHRVRAVTDSLGADQAGRAAADLGAQLFVLGTSTQVGGRLQLSAALYDRRAPGRPVSVATAEGDAAAIFDVVDRLARGLLAGRYAAPAQRLSRLGAETTRSVEALRAYLAGERLYRGGDYAAAGEAFQHAVTLDSTFALAYYRLSNTAAWLGRDDVTRGAIDRAVALAGAVPVNEARLFQAWSAYVYGDGDSAEQVYRKIVTDRPTDVEAWYRLAEVLFHYGPTYGRTLAEAGQAFEQLLRFEPDNLEALVHLARIAARERAPARLDSLIRRVRALNAPQGDLLELAELRALSFRDSRGEAAVRAALVLTEPHLKEWIASAAIAFAEDPGAAARLGLDDYADGAEPQAILNRVLLAHAELAQGRWRAAGAELDRLAAVAPALALELRAVLATLPFMDLAERELRALLASTATPPAPTPGYVAPGQLSMQPPWTGGYARGLLHVALRERNAALKVARELEERPPPAARLLTAREDTVRSDVRLHLARIIRARVLEQQGDARAALRILGPPDLPRLRVLPGIMQHPTAAERFLRATLLARLGRADEALRWLATIPDPSGYDAVYLAPAHFLRASILEERGDRAPAAFHYARVVELWRNADPELQPMVRRAQARMEQLRG